MPPTKLQLSRVPQNLSGGHQRDQVNKIWTVAAECKLVAPSQKTLENSQTNIKEKSVTGYSNPSLNVSRQEEVQALERQTYIYVDEHCKPANPCEQQWMAR